MKSPQGGALYGKCDGTHIYWGNNIRDIIGEIQGDRIFWLRNAYHTDHTVYKQYFLEYVIRKNGIWRTDHFQIHGRVPRYIMEGNTIHEIFQEGSTPYPVAKTTGGVECAGAYAIIQDELVARNERDEFNEDERYQL
jgi:hypothetical protein